MELNEAKQIIANLKAISLKLGDDQSGQISHIYHLLQQLDKIDYTIDKAKEVNSITYDLTNIQNKLDQYKNDLDSTVQNIDLSKVKEDIESFIDSINQSIIKDNQKLKNQMIEHRKNAFSIFEEIQTETKVLKNLKVEINTGLQKISSKKDLYDTIRDMVLGGIIVYTIFVIGPKYGFF